MDATVAMASMPTDSRIFRSIPLRRLDEEDEDEKKTPAPEPQSSPVAQALFKSRTVLIFGEIDMKLAERVCAQLLAYSAESEDDIRVIVNSPGGHVESGDTI